MDSQLWTDKHFPKCLADFVGNSAVVEAIDAWAKAWNSGKHERPLILHGQTGAGKTVLAHLIANINNWQVFELNASDFRTKEIIEKLAGAAAFNASFTGQLRLVLLDEIDCLQAQDRGGAVAIVNILKQSQNPAILTANDIYADKKLATIRAACTLLEFKKINYISIANYLKKICKLNNINYDDAALTELAKNSSGDLRAALLDLQTLSMGSEKISLEGVSLLGYRERNEKIFSILRKIFAAKTLRDARAARLSSEVSEEMLQNWIEENIPRAYTDVEDLANAFERLSKADIYNGRIMKRQHYGFLRYSSELMSSGVALAKKQSYNEFTMYQFPKFLSKLSSSNSARALRKSLATKLSGQMHSSMHDIIADDLAYLKIIFENKQNAINLTVQFEFDENELAFLLNTSPETKKVQAIIEEASKLMKKQTTQKKRILNENAEFADMETQKQEIPRPVASEGQRKLF